MIAILVTWSLAEATFPQFLPESDASVHWTLGIAGMLGLFISVILHELGHAVVARGYGIDIRSITLFIFGGVAEMREEPKSAKAEFFVAIAGPAVSLALAVGFGLIGAIAQPAPLRAWFQYIGSINAILLIFNLVPAFPLDGGRVLRAALWKHSDSLKKATRTASRTGYIFGAILVGLGIFQLFVGSLIGAIWWVLIGFFLQNAARMSYTQLLFRCVLEGEPIREFMNDEPITVSPELTVQDLVEDYFYRHHHKTFPVVEDGRLVGMISLKAVKAIERNAWAGTSVCEIMEPVSDRNSIPSQTDAMHVLGRMHKDGASRLAVVEGDRVIGIVSLKDLLRFLSLKIELEEGDTDATPVAQPEAVGMPGR